MTATADPVEREHALENRHRERTEREAEAQRESFAAMSHDDLVNAAVWLFADATRLRAALDDATGVVR